jgi:hypothetical protein
VAKPQAILDRFIADLDGAESLLQSVHALRKPTKPARGLPQLQLNLVYELAYLRAYLAWEVFLEDIFFAFMLGAKSVAGKAPSRYFTPSSRKHAETMVLRGQRFVRWTDAREIRDRAELLFHAGEPFAPALKAAPHLNDMRIVRNRIAHNSGEAVTKFAELRERLYAAEISKSGKNVVKGMGPGAFLQRPFSKAKQTPRFGVYLQELRDTGRTIAS